MTQKDRIEAIEKSVLANSNAIERLECRVLALFREWKIYEDEYIKYINKKRWLRRLVWRLYRKITCRSVKPTRKELIRRTAKNMARVFYDGDN